MFCLSGCALDSTWYEEVVKKKGLSRQKEPEKRECY